MATAQLWLRPLLLLVCMTVSVEGSLRVALVSMSSLQAQGLEPMGPVESPSEEVPVQQESSDSPTSNELPEETGKHVCTGERKGKRPARLCAIAQRLVVRRTQRAVQIHSGCLIVFEHQYRNGCGAHLRC